MGWKAIKDYFGIEDIVHVKNGFIYVGNTINPYMIEISAKGDVTYGEGTYLHEGMMQLVSRMRIDRASLLRLLSADDQFGPTQTVYSRDDDVIWAHECEQYGWPNVTTNGILMEKGLFWETIEEAAANGISELQHQVDSAVSQISKAREQLASLQVDLSTVEKCMLDEVAGSAEHSALLQEADRVRGEVGRLTFLAERWEATLRRLENRVARLAGDITPVPFHPTIRNAHDNGSQLNQTTPRAFLRPGSPEAESLRVSKDIIAKITGMMT